jgi:hypothetical protein
MKKQVLLFSILFGISLHILSCASYKTETQSIEASKEVILFLPQKLKGVSAGSDTDIVSYRKIAEELGYSHRTVDHRFINTRESFFDNDGKRKFRVLLFPGGEPNLWF